MNSLDSTLWIDQTHIERETGQEVFQTEKNALNKLSQLSKGTTNPLPGVVLQGIFEQILRADRLLGSVAVEDAIDAGVSGKKIVEAQAELAAGDAEAANGRFEQAIERYREAWQRAVSGN